MKLNFAIGLCATALLAGCSSGSSLLDTKAGVPQAANVPVGNNLALPPDLQLATPTATSDRYQPNGYVAPIAVPNVRPASQAVSFADPQLPKPPPGTATAMAAPVVASDNIYANAIVDRAMPADYYAKYGISRFKPNGQLKTPAELKKELMAAVLAKKRAANPNYGTISNFGNLGAGGDDLIMRP